VLAEIGAGNHPDLVVWNKRDLAPPADVDRLLAACRGSVAVSGATGEGIDQLRVAIAERLRALDRVVELIVPYDRGDVLAALHRDGEVLVEVHDDGGTRVRARLSDPVLSRFRGFVTAEA
jgi:GTP-binding protein HflX